MKILDAKQKFASGQLEINIPPILKKIYDHSKGLRFDEQPNYTKMKEICKEGFNKASKKLLNQDLTVLIGVQLIVK